MSNLPRFNPTELIRLIKDGSKALNRYNRVDPKQRYVLIYPNCDNAYVGMGFNLLNIAPAEEIFEKASKLMKTDILRLCLKGPREELLDSLENRHVATYVTSHATVAKLLYEQPHLTQYVSAAAGIGVGLINSLVYTNSMTFEDGLELVQLQAKAMERAAKVVPSAKLILKMKPATQKTKVCRAAIEHCLGLGIPEEIAVCSVTRQTSPHRIEVSGHIEGIKYLEEEGTRLFQFYELKRVEHSPFAYYTDLMRPASEFLRVFIDDKLKKNPSYIKPPEDFRLYSATAGHRIRKLETILKDLYSHPIKPIQIEQLFHSMYDRSNKLAQPNTLVLWDRSLLKHLSLVNKKAWSSAKLLKA